MAVALVVAACAATPAGACDIGRWQPHIAEASRRYGIAEDWIRAVMRAESAGCTHLDGRPITSHAGAMGLMQLMPATWTELRQRHGFGNDVYDPRENILAGTAYLRELIDRFGVPGAFAAYHAGPRRYEAHRTQGAPLPLETRRYLSQVSADVGIADAVHVTEQTAIARVDPLFAAVARGHRRQETDDTPPSYSRLFVRLQHGRYRAANDPSDLPEHSHVQPSPASLRWQPKQQQKNGRQDKRGRHRRWHNTLCDKALRRHSLRARRAALMRKSWQYKALLRAVHAGLPCSALERRHG